MNKPKPQPRWWQLVLLLPFVPFLVVLVLLALVCFVLASVCLHITIWGWWCLRGRDILFVYSESPIWQAYIEANVLPYLGERAVVLNWSQRKHWRVSVAGLAFYHFGGYRRFNPLAVVFRPFHRSRTFRFWQPFKDFKHGHPEPLRRMERDFFGLIGVHRHEPSA